MPEFGNSVGLLLLPLTMREPDPEMENATGDGASGSVTD
jgi:hypothetical protein